MLGGSVSGSHYKLGTGFTFVAKALTFEVPSTGGSTTVWQTALYNGELGAWLGTTSWRGHPFYPSAPSGSVVVYDSSSYVSEGLSTAITSANFCQVSVQSSGNGSVTASGTAYGEYRLAGSNVTFTATPSTGYKVKKMILNGSTVDMSSYVSGAFTHTISNIQQDYSCVVYFVPTQYQVTCNTPSGGTVSFTKNGNSATVPFYANVDDVIVCTATPNADKMVQNFVLDGTICSGGSTGPQNFSFTIFEREDDAVYNCTVAFSDRTAVTDSVVGKSDGSTDDATVTCNGSSVTRTSGAFMAYVGNTYLATAHEPTIFRTYNGWINGNGEVVSSEYTYGWTQGSQSVAITALYTDNPLYTEDFYVGTSTSDYGTGSTAYVAGCRADITRPTGESKVIEGVTKYLGGTRTVSAHGSAGASDPLPTGWTFSGVYVMDTDKSGGTKFYEANGASSVTFVCACNANIYAIFSNGGSVDPADVDQGNSSIAVSVNGLSHWEGSESNMTMVWHSRRNIASMPMTISTARVYADAYSTSGTNDVKLKVLTFQSPESTDAKAVDTTAKSQDAYRLPMRRPEKYIEMVVTAPHQVTQIAIGTSMEALWQI